MLTLYAQFLDPNPIEDLCRKVALVIVKRHPTIKLKLMESLIVTWDPIESPTTTQGRIKPSGAQAKFKGAPSLLLLLLIFSSRSHTPFPEHYCQLQK